MSAGPGDRRLGVRAAFVDRTWVPGDVVVRNGLIAAVGVDADRPVAADRRAVPGFVDVQVNGFAGVDFTSADEDGYRLAAAAMARTGVTSFLPTIPTANPDRYLAALAVADHARRHGTGSARALGVHLEGPFLSPAKPGAHNPAWLRPPDTSTARAWIETGAVAMMTLAPELPGALDLIRLLVEHDVVVSLGHTDASADEAREGFDAGASMVTHLWNAQRQISSRDPGAGGVALARDDTFVGVICDLVHVAPETVRLSHRAAGDRFVLVTDAVSYAGLPDGEYAWAGRPVHVHDGAVRLGDGTLAGSSCPMDVALRRLVSAGVPLEAALVAATASPAAAVRRPDVGDIRPGMRADVVVLDDGCNVGTVLIDGVAID